MPNFSGRVLHNAAGKPLSLIKFNDVLSDIKNLKALASTYQLEFVGLQQLAAIYTDKAVNQFGQHALVSVDEGVGLVDLRDPKLLPLCVDFAADALLYRKDKGGGKNEAIAKAVGIKSTLRPCVVDATAGLGTDSFILASLGCQVTMLERTNIVCALLHDGLDRGSEDVQSRDIVARMKLLPGNAVERLQELIEQKQEVDVVYLDPMFPHKKKSAAVKKPMKMFQTLLGHDADADDLLTPALTLAAKRVVVKRPNYAPFLQDKAPTMQIKGKKHRFDVYLR
jgi:16S rRNA (guanine1516-N2)-methyltransferase